MQLCTFIALNFSPVSPSPINTPVTVTDEQSLIAAAEELGRQALRQGSIHSFIVRHFADGSQFYIPDEQQEPLTPERAYMRFKAMVVTDG